AFVNVMTNSVQAMQGEGVLSLATETQEGAVKVTIRDSGPGIPKPYLGRVFDPFFTTKGQGEGTGLGLTVVQRIVTKYGGRVQIQSEEGRGTSCFITFPVRASTSAREKSR
ncbi:MAG: ATP-binding protein, partial [Nitrospirota bacterium]|nr:ATP-binding protein [Nitrospirota bacterium]